MAHEHLTEPLLAIAREAGRIIMEYYEGSVEVHLKADASPVTVADLAANDYIVRELKVLTPNLPIVSEEDHEHHDAGITNWHGEDLKETAFWLVDPLDGTKSFIRHTGEFTVNIGLVSKGKPMVGVVYAPVEGVCYYTGDNGKAYKKGKTGKAKIIEARTPGKDGLVVVTSQSHNSPKTDAYVAKLGKVKERISSSSSIKLCLIAEGKADVYPRLGTTMEWDTAAAHAVLNAAGGSLIGLDGAPFVYAKDGFKNPHFVAKGR